MPMKLTETTIYPAAIRMRFADHADATKATEWIDFQVPLAGLKRPNDPAEKAMTDPELQFVSEVRLAALRYVRGIIGDETQRLSKSTSHSS